MPRLVHISIDTTVKSVSITDSDLVSGEVFLDYNGKMGQPLTFNRASDIPYNDPTCAIRFVTDNGTTGYFTIYDVADVVVDGMSIGPSTIQDIINGISSDLFKPVGGVFLPAIVTDIDGPHNLSSGQTYTCLPCPPASATTTLNFGVGLQNVIFQRMSMQGTFNSSVLTNVATSSIYKNDVLVTVPFSFNNGDRIFVEITRTNPALAASIALNTSGITNALTFSSTTYYKPRTTHYVENMTTTQNYVDGIGVKGTGSTLSYLTNCIFTNPVKGVFEIQMPPINSIGSFTNFRYGLNNLTVSNTVANRFPRCQYMILIRNNFFEILELGVSKANVLIAYTELHWSKITSTYTSPGVYTIRYYYSDNDRATWTLLYTSLTTHNGTVNFHSDFVANYGYYLQTHVAELTQN